MAKILAPLFTKKILVDDDLRLKLAKANNVKVSTIDRWLRTDDEMLTTASNLELISNYYDVVESAELLQDVQKALA